MLQVVTVCTHDAGWFAALRASCARHGLPLAVLGWGQPWRGFNWRLHLMREHLRSLPADALVLFVDAYDVLILQDEATIVERFLRLSDGGARVLFGTEHLANHSRAFDGGMTMIFGGRCRGRFLNAGCYLGRVAAVARYLDVVHDGDAASDDQALLNGVCFHRPHRLHDCIAVDARGEVLCNAAGWRCILAPSSRCLERLDGLGLRWERGAGGWSLVNRLTGTVPCVLHLPGAVNMDPVCRRLGLPLGRPRGFQWPPTFGFTLGCTLVACVVVWVAASVSRRGRGTDGAPRLLPEQR